MSERAVYLVTGPSAAGKSTVARALAARFDRSALIEGDVFRRAIIRGRAEMTPAPSVEALAQLQLRYRLAASVADAYFDAGFTVVLEDVIAGKLLEDVVGMIRARPLHVVVLLPTVEVVAARETGRTEDGYSRFTVEQLHRGFAEETPRLGLWLDSSGQMPDETVDTILESLVASRV